MWWHYFLEPKKYYEILIDLFKEFCDSGEVKNQNIKVYNLDYLWKLFEDEKQIKHICSI